MSGQLKAASGTVALPGLCFSSDTDCGFYRIGADNVGLALAGAKVLDVATTGLAVTGTLSATGASTLTGAVATGALSVTGAITATTTITATGAISGAHGSVPIGAISDYAGSSAPTGWLFCYGQAVSRTTYASLFTAISTAYGTGDGSTTFNLPDCRGRVAAGKDDMGGSSANRLTNQTDGLNGDTLGATGGTETQAYTQQGSFTTGVNNTGFSADGGATVVASNGHTHSVTISGSTVAGNNVQPTIVFNKIIYAGVA